jgi:hypothetical protein
MSDVIYAITFKGEILEGHQIISVKAHLAKLLKVGPDQMAKLFSGKQVVLKKTPDKAIAIKYGSALKKVGADVKVKVIKAAVDAPAQQPAKPATIPTPSSGKIPAPAARPAATQAKIPSPQAPQSVAGNFELAPNEGNIFDPTPETPAPEINLDALSLAEAEEGVLTEPKEEVVLDLDLSELHLAEAGEGLLVEPEPEAPKIEAPDFGLDEPGAMLETLHEEVELVNPDTSGLTLALAGSDLLPEEEKEPEPAPEAPDTSKIHLVPNFDMMTEPKEF